MDKKLPKYQGRSTQTNNKEKLFDQYPIFGKVKISIPELEQKQNKEDKTSNKDLFGKIKTLFESKKETRLINNKDSSVKTINNVMKNMEKLFRITLVSTKENEKDKQVKTYNTDSVVIKETPIIFSKFEKPIYPQDKKQISVFNSYTGKNPATTNNAYNNSNVINEEFNITSKNSNLSTLSDNTNNNIKYGDNNFNSTNSTKNLTSTNLHKKSNYTKNLAPQSNRIKNNNSNIFRKYYISNNLEENNNSNLKSDSIQNLNSRSDSIQNLNSRSDSIQNLNELNLFKNLSRTINPKTSNVNNFQSKQINSTLFSKTITPISSVERQPYFVRENNTNYIKEPIITNKKQDFLTIPSFKEGGSFNVKGTHKGSTVTIKAGERAKSETISVAPKKENTMSQAALKIQESAMEEKAMSSEQQKDQQANDQAQDNASSGGSVTNTSFNTTNIVKKITTFEKVAIETFMLPAWRRVFA